MCPNILSTELFYNVNGYTKSKGFKSGDRVKRKNISQRWYISGFFLSIQGPSHVKLFLLCYDFPSHLVSCHHVRVEAQIHSVIKYLTRGSYFSVVRLPSKKGNFSALKHWITLVSCLALLRPEGNPGKPMHIYPASWMHFCLLCIQDCISIRYNSFLTHPSILHSSSFVMATKYSPWDVQLKKYVDIMLGKTTWRMLSRQWSGECGKGMGLDALYHVWYPLPYRLIVFAALALLCWLLERKGAKLECPMAVCYLRKRQEVCTDL